MRPKRDGPHKSLHADTQHPITTVLMLPNVNAWRERTRAPLANDGLRPSTETYPSTPEPNSKNTAPFSILPCCGNEVTATEPFLAAPMLALLFPPSAQTAREIQSPEHHSRAIIPQLQLGVAIPSPAHVDHKHAPSSSGTPSVSSANRQRSR